MKTLFEKIRDQEIPADVLHRDEHCFVFRDISPQAPVHFLVVPNEPISRIACANQDHQKVLGHLLLVASRIAGQQGIGESGFRIVINNGQEGGETVPHLHVHVLGGRALTWPPG